ncbi:MAG: hypothetical protein GY929_00975 [Actinomycetia bacterium]|nr:hypothetical protein [Actinomycetes bacterium]
MSACSPSDGETPTADEALTAAEVLGAPAVGADEPVGPLLANLPAAGALPESASDADLDRLARQCGQGIVIGCDMLAAVSPPDSPLLDYAQSCGGRNRATLSCAVEYSDLSVSVEAFAGETLPDPGPSPSGAGGDLDRLAGDCRDRDLLACDVLQFRTEAGSVHHAYASTCGSRTETPVVCTVWFRLVDPAVTIPTSTVPSS